MTLQLTKRIAGGMIGLFVGTLLALAAPLTYAQTTTDATVNAAVTTPGAPATGEGGGAATDLMVLGVSALALAAGGAYLARTKREA
jgi:hypothetical protein